MTSADQGQPGTAPQWLTLTEAAIHSGYSRDAIRQRIRRGTLKATKGNGGQLRVQARDLDDLPPPDTSPDDQGRPEDRSAELAMDVLRTTVDELRIDLERTRTTLDAAQTDRLNDRGRAERAEAQAKAQEDRAAVAEARLTASEAALAEAQTPLLLRVIRAVRGR